MPFRSAVGYLICLAIAAVVVMLAPIPFRHIGKLMQTDLRPTLRADAKTIMFGSSGIDTISQCDRDRRTIVGMMAEALGSPVIDGSWGNQTIEEGVSLAGLAARAAGIRHVVLTSAWLEAPETNTMGVHDYLTFRMLNPWMDLDGPLTYFRSHQTAFTRPLRAYDRFTYKGVAYPGLNGFDDGLFARERAARTCPENDGHEPAAIEAIYFHRQVEYPPADANARLIISLHRHLAASGKSLLFTMLPLNLQYLQRFDPAWPGILRERRDIFMTRLRENGVVVLDLSESLGHATFIDRWCACTHYSEAGRLFVAQRIAEKLGIP